MLGYVKVYQPQLKIGEFEQYRGIYCSLCRTLGKRYGIVSQMALSYDVTFLVLLFMALSEECVGFEKGHCVYNPCKRRLKCGEHSALTFGADISVLLMHHRLQDTVADSRFAKRMTAGAAKSISKKDYRRASNRLPETDRLLSDCMKQQSELEKSKTASLDAAAEPTATMLSHLCSIGASDEKQRRVLERLGYCLGSWVYRMDAVDDLADDIKHNTYNPLRFFHPVMSDDAEAIQKVRNEILFSLNALLAECKAAYDLLTIHHFDGILRNILDYGMPYMQNQVVYGKGGKTNEKSL